MQGVSLDRLRYATRSARHWLQLARAEAHVRNHFSIIPFVTASRACLHVYNTTFRRETDVPEQASYSAESGLDKPMTPNAVMRATSSETSDNDLPQMASVFDVVLES